MAGLGLVFAKDGNVTGGDTRHGPQVAMESVLAEVIAAAKSAGALGALLFLYLWLRAEKRIEALQARNEQLIERVFTALSDTKDALRELRGMFGARNGR